MFPFLNRKLNFSQEVEEHKVIHAKLDEILGHLTAAKADPSKFDAPKLKSMMDDFRDPLVRQLPCHVCLILMRKDLVFTSRRGGQGCCPGEDPRLR